MALCIVTMNARIKPKPTKIDEKAEKGTTTKSISEQNSDKKSTVQQKELKTTAQNTEKKKRSTKKNSSQKAKAYLDISSDYESFGYNGGTVTFYVNSNREWRIDKDIYTLGNLTRSGNKLTLQVFTNNRTQSRSDYFTLKGGNVERTVRIYQSGKPEPQKVSTTTTPTPYLKVDRTTSDKTIYFEETGGRVYYNVNTSDASYETWGVPTWCSIENKTASGFTLVCSKNISTTSRSDYMLIKAAGKQIRIDIKQNAKTVTTFAPRNYGGYSNYTYNSNYRRKSFNRKQDDYWGGVSVGYIQKQWTWETDGSKEKMGMFDDDKYINGIQAGIRIDPQFGWGIGMNTGVFYEYCWAKSNTMTDSYGDYYYSYNEHGVYMPAHLKYTMNFSEWFQLSFYGGVGLNYVFSGKVKLKDDYDTDYSEDVFDWDDMKKFNLMLEYGASIRIKALQFDFSMSQGLTNWSDTSGEKFKQGRPMSVSATICF